MVVINALFSCDLENVAEVALSDAYVWQFDVSQSNGTEMRERITLSASDKIDIPNSRGTANFVMKWPDSKQPSTITVEPQKNKTKNSYTADDAPKQICLGSFECRGAEPVKWYPGSGFRVKSRGGTEYKDVDLSEGDWTDYCERKGEVVGIYNVKCTIQ